MARKRSSKVEAIQQVSLFSACSKRELGQIASLVDQVDVPEGHKLTTEGAPGRECFVVIEGKAKATLRGRKLAEYGPGDFFGEMSLLDQGPRSATVVATTPMSLYVLDARTFSTLLDKHPGVARKVLRGLAQRLRNVEKAPSH